jgi:hypothetical protein
MSRAVTTAARCAAPPETVDRVLKDLSTWTVWAPRIRPTRYRTAVIGPDWQAMVRSPGLPVRRAMRVTWCEPGRGVRWRSTLARHGVHHAYLVEPAGSGGSRLVWSLELHGPLSRVLTALIRPVCRAAQRRATRRLAALAEVVAHVARPG